MGKRHKRRKRRTPLTPPGSSPGTIHVDSSAPQPRISILAYGAEDLIEKEIGSPDELPALLGKWPVLWVNVDGLGNADIIRRIGEIFNLHPLSLEDVVNVHQRPKAEQYDDYLYIVTHMALRQEHLVTEQLSIFLGERFVVTFQEREGDCLEPVRARVRKQGTRFRRKGQDYLAYAIMDAVVDNYFPLLDQYGDQLEQLQDDILAGSSVEVVKKIHDIRYDLTTMRRILHPLRDALNSLIRDGSPMVTEGSELFFRDCHDHVVQLIELLQSDRETAAGLMDLYLVVVSNRMNEVMKVLTIFAAIFIPLTFVAGIYGMNFNPENSPWNMPELGWYWGYPLALGIMAVIAAAMVLYFWKKRFFK